MQTQEERLNVKIELNKDFFIYSNGIFVEVFGGVLTKIVERF
jgi:hypothetical protein